MKYLLLMLCISALILVSCSSEKEYPVKITEENGVKTISNPDYPKEGVYDLVLEELFTLGKDEDNSKYIFTNPFQIMLDKNDNLFLLDWETYKFYVFNKDGEYIRQFGRRGRGPGDFEIPLFFNIANNNELILNDGGNKRICYYDSTGKYLHGFPYNNRHSFINLDSGNNIYSDEIKIETEKVSGNPKPFNNDRVILRYDAVLNKWNPIGTFTGEKVIMREVFSGGISVEGMLNAFFWTISPKDKIFTGFEDVYEFSIYSLNGTPLQKFNRKYKPFTNPNYKEGSRNSRYLSAFTDNNIFDDIGNFWVNINNGRKPNIYIYDIYSENGIYQKQVYSKFKIKLLKCDRAYSIVYGENEPVYVKAFKYSLKRRG